MLGGVPDDFLRAFDEVLARSKKFNDANKRITGMLSGNDIIDLTVPEGIATTYLDNFKGRRWENLTIDKDDSGTVISARDYGAHIYISNFSKFNVTPFSYDLSFGKQFFSIQKANFSEVSQPYVIDPGESILAITEEYIAIPMHYSATIWPRFGIVRKGIFQSMVKIDPTWYGRLAVALSNLSPVSITLNPGEPFATLLLYALNTPSKYDLWRPTDENLKAVARNVDLPEVYREASKRNAIDKYIKEHKLDHWLTLHGEQMQVRGLKRDELEQLRKFTADPNWKSFCLKVAEEWATATHPSTGRGVVWMNTIGQEDLSEIVKVTKEGRMSLDNIRGMCSQDDLLQMAENYGKPFDVIAKIPLTVKTAATAEMSQKIETMGEDASNRVEATVVPRMITLMFSILGLLSLIIAVLIYATRILTDGQRVPDGSLTLMLVVLMIIGAVTVTGMLWINKRETKYLKQVVKQLFLNQQYEGKRAKLKAWKYKK